MKNVIELEKLFEKAVAIYHPNPKGVKEIFGLKVIQWSMIPKGEMWVQTKKGEMYKWASSNNNAKKENK